MGSNFTKPLQKDKQKTYLIQTCDEHESSVNCMEVSDDNSVIVTGSDDTNIRLWSTQSECIECIGLLEGHKDYITSLFIEGNYVLSSSADKTIRKWDMSTCECVLIYLGHESTVNKIICGNGYLFSVSYDKKAKCWDFDTGECLNTFTGHKNNIPMVLYISSNAKNTRKDLYDNKKTLASKLRLNNEDEESVSEDVIITGSYDSLAKSWSIEKGECLHTFKGHTAAITCLTADYTGKLLFSGSSDHSIRSWEIATGKLLKIFEGHSSTIIAITTEKKILYSAGADHTARCWVMEFGDCTRVYKEHNHGVHQIFENRGLVFTASGDGIARCFDAKSASLKRMFKGHTGAVNCLKIIDEKLFTGSYDGTLRVWDASELAPEKQSVQPNEYTKPKMKTKKTYDENMNMIKAKNTNQKVIIENENYYSSKKKSIHLKTIQHEVEDDDQDFYEKYSRRQNQNLNSRNLDYD